MATQLQYTPEYAFADGAFSAGAKVSFFLSGTTTPATVYADQALTTPHPSPLVADATGRFATVWGTNGVNYKAVITAADDSAIATVDPVVLGNVSIGQAVDLSYSPITENPQTNVQAAITYVSQAVGANTVTAAGRALLDDADASAQLSTLGVTAFAKTILDDADASAVRATIGASNLTQVQVEDDASTVFGTVSGERLSQAVKVYAIGWGDRWQDVLSSRAVTTSFQNVSGRPIEFSITFSNSTVVQSIQVSTDNVSWVNLARSQGNPTTCSAIIGPDEYYRVTQTGGTTVLDVWSERRL